MIYPTDDMTQAETALKAEHARLRQVQAALVVALEYCAYAPGELAACNQAQYLVARKALAIMKGQP
jgi:hypothetical protein